MTLASYILGGLVALLTLSQIVLDHRLKNLPENHKRKRRTLRKILLWITLGLFVANQVVIGVSTHRKDRAAVEAKRASDEKLSQLNEQLKEERKASAFESAQLNSNFNAKASLLNSNLVDLKNRYDALVSAIATNPMVAASIRSQVMTADEQFRVVSGNMTDINDWVANLDHRINAMARKSAMEKLHNQEVAKQKWVDNSEIFRHTIQRFQLKLEDVGRFLKQPVISNFKGIPLTATYGSLGEFQVGTNSVWQFDVSIQRPGDAFLCISVKSASPATSLDVMAIGQVFVHPGPLYYREISLSTYKTNIDDAIYDFLAQTKKLEKPKE
jgi:hypothetical protein